MTLFDQKLLRPNNGADFNLHIQIKANLSPYDDICSLSAPTGKTLQINSIEVNLENFADKLSTIFNTCFTCQWNSHKSKMRYNFAC